MEDIYVLCIGNLFIFKGLGAFFEKKKIMQFSNDTIIIVGFVCFFLNTKKKKGISKPQSNSWTT